MKYCIKENWHYGYPLVGPSIRINKTHHEITARVIFDESAKYYLGDDQSDVNKLIGVSYGYHHDQSDRIGWRYNHNTRMVEIVLYSYVNGKRMHTQHLIDLPLDRRLNIVLEVDIKGNRRSVEVKVFSSGSRYSVTYDYEHKPKPVSYLLGGYFGGNNKAPHDINYLMDYQYECF